MKTAEEWARESDVERFDFTIYGDASGGMEPSVDGDYVRHDDYQSLALKLSSAQTELREMDAENTSLLGRLDAATTALTACYSAVPNTWLDELLSGTKAVKVNNEDGGVEKLLNRVRDRIGAIIKPHIEAHNAGVVEKL